MCLACRSHWWPSGYSRRLSDMKCTVMIWRSRVRSTGHGWLICQWTQFRDIHLERFLSPLTLDLLRKTSHDFFNSGHETCYLQLLSSKLYPTYILSPMYIRHFISVKKYLPWCFAFCRICAHLNHLNTQNVILNLTNFYSIWHSEYVFSCAAYEF